ncbi:MAG: hypothetical protein ACOC1F_14165 [Myxococcota bacterium]
MGSRHLLGGSCDEGSDSSHAVRSPPDDGTLSVVACGSDDDDGESPGSSGSAALGESCEAYYGDNGCCMEAAGETQHSEDACAQSLEQIESAIANGAKPSDYEAACQSALDAAQSAGVCQ